VHAARTEADSLVLPGCRGQAIVTLAGSDVLTLRNHTSAAAVTLQTLAGGTQPHANVSLVIEKLKGAAAPGTRALKHGWPYSTANAMLAAGIGIPYLDYLNGLTVLVLAFPVSSGTLWIGFALMPILLYARLRMKRVLHPELKFGEEPPAAAKPEDQCWNSIYEACCQARF
jgi:hypothetical protein